MVQDPNMMQGQNMQMQQQPGQYYPPNMNQQPMGVQPNMNQHAMDVQHKFNQEMMYPGYNKTNKKSKGPC